jgi:hypothetical protein
MLLGQKNQLAGQYSAKFKITELTGNNKSEEIKTTERHKLQHESLGENRSLCGLHGAMKGHVV